MKPNAYYSKIKCLFVVICVNAPSNVVGCVKVSHVEVNTFAIDSSEISFPISKPILNFPHNDGRFETIDWHRKMEETIFR